MNINLEKELLALGKEVHTYEHCKDCGLYCLDNADQKDSMEGCSESGYTEYDLEDNLIEVDSNCRLMSIFLDRFGAYDYWLRKEGIFQVSKNETVGNDGMRYGSWFCDVEDWRQEQVSMEMRYAAMSSINSLR